MTRTTKTASSLRSGPGRDEMLLHAGAFLSSIGVLLVAPYLAVYLTRDIGWSATAAGFGVGLGFWFTRVAGLAGGWACRRVPPAVVMHGGNGLRIVGYLLFLDTHPALIVGGLVLTGAGAGLYFPAAKDLLIRVVPEPRQLRSLAIRNAAANLGTALGPLVGLVAFHADPRLMFGTAAGVFLALTLSQLSMRLGDGAPRHPATAAVPTMAFLRPLLLVAAADGVAAILLESAFPQVVASTGTDRMLTAMFLANSVAVILLQPVGLRLVSRSARLALPLGLLAVALGVLPFSLAAAGPAVWVCGVLLIAFAEVVVALWLDDRVRHLPHPASIYGRLSLFDGFGGLLGATVASWLTARTLGAADVLANALWVLAGGYVAAGTAVLLLRPRWADPTTSATPRDERKPATP